MIKQKQNNFFFNSMNFTADGNTFRKNRSQEELLTTHNLYQTSQNINHLLFKAQQIIQDEIKQPPVKTLKILKAKTSPSFTDATCKILDQKQEQRFFSKTHKHLETKKQAFFPDLPNQQTYTERLLPYARPRIKIESQPSKTQEQFTKKQSERIESMLGYNMTFYAKNLFKDLNYDPFVKKTRKIKSKKTVKFSKLQETFFYQDY